MERLSQLFQTVDRLVDQNFEKAMESSTSVKDRKVKKRSGSDTIKRESILSLHLNHKWDADLIADRLKMDPATVRAIISAS
jgi:hypothetical protein